MDVDDVTVVIGTFGHHSWVTLAHERASASAKRLGFHVEFAHGRTLHDARNEALERVTTPWVIHLDADDELEPGFLAAAGAHGDQADIVAPAVRYVTPGGRFRAPRMPTVAAHRHDCTADCLIEGNWIVVGALARTSLLTGVGGWRDFPIYEDWDLWLRCWSAGARISAAPAAVYRAHVRPDSRNRGPERETKEHWHRVIFDENFGTKTPR